MTPRLKWNLDSDVGQRGARVVALHALAALEESSGRLRRKDPDSLHQFRLALRRLRSWIHVFRPALDDTLRRRTRKRLTRIMRATAVVRDLDVHIAWLTAECTALGTERLEAAGWIVRSLERDRRVAWKRFRKLFRKEFGHATAALESELMEYVVTRDVRRHDSEPAMRRLTERSLQRETAALSAALSRIRSADDTRRLHRARIVAKRARYVLEALAKQAPLANGAADDLHRFQDLVGELRDAQLLAHRVTREITVVAAERTALVTSELVYYPSGPMDFTRVVTESPFDASLSLLLARLRDRIAAASRAVTLALEKDAAKALVTRVEHASRALAAHAPAE
ncbi:MAG: CHAD domain-containing protein [Gemmatimonadota bacterium]|nr:CHAD domain-containing protein [Gemmatimonadota bacterium]